MSLTGQRFEVFHALTPLVDGFLQNADEQTRKLTEKAIIELKTDLEDFGKAKRAN